MNQSRVAAAPVRQELSHRSFEEARKSPQGCDCSVQAEGDGNGQDSY